MNTGISERFESIIEDLSQGVYEKDREIRLALLAALSGESIILLGPPGVAKSMIARQMKNAVAGAKSFEYLMSRFSTPDEIFGPVSIGKLKETDRYERRTEGYLPDSDVVFLDEIWKAGPAIQNTLLTAINEKVFRNGDHEIQLPLKLLVAASNELPAQGEGLEALWDRFLVRMVCGCIQDEKQFYSMLLDDGSKVGRVRNPISPEEYEKWRKAIEDVKVSPDVLTSITDIREGLKNIAVKDSEQMHQVYVSDRRWKKILGLLKAEAFIRGKKQVEASDLFIIHNCLWNSPEECQDVKLIVMNALVASLRLRLKALKTELETDLKTMQLRKAMSELHLTKDEKQMKVYDGFYYCVSGHGTGHTYILMNDYLSLERQWDKPHKGVMYPTAEDPNKLLIHSIENMGRGARNRYNYKGKVDVMLYRDDMHVYINGVRYDIEMTEDGKDVDLFESPVYQYSGRDYTAEIRKIEEGIVELSADISSNPFIPESEDEDMKTMFAGIGKELDMAKIDVAKLKLI